MLNRLQALDDAVERRWPGAVLRSSRPAPIRRVRLVGALLAVGGGFLALYGLFDLLHLQDRSPLLVLVLAVAAPVLVQGPLWLVREVDKRETGPPSDTAL